MPQPNQNRIEEIVEMIFDELPIDEEGEVILKDFPAFKSKIRLALVALQADLEKAGEGLKREKVTGGFDGQAEMNIEIATHNQAIDDFLTAQSKVWGTLEAKN